MDNKHVFDDDEIINYLEGSTPGKSRQEFERKAYIAGDLSDLYRMHNDIYDAHSDLADDLLGQDITYSEELQHVFEEALKLRSDKPADVSMAEYLKSLLIERLSLSVSEAERVYEQIVGGVTIYYSCYDHQVAQIDEDSYFPTIESAMADLTTNEKITYLSNVYLLLLAFNGRINNSNLKNVKEHLAHFSPSSGREDDLLTMLQGRIKDELADAELPGSIITEENLRKLKNDFSIKSILDARRMDQDFSVYSAVCAYIAQSNDDIHLTNKSVDKGINPVAIGLGVAAGVKQTELTQKVLTGEIEESRFIKFIKIAACVAAFALVAYLALHFAAPVVGEVLQILPLEATAGFWWNAWDVATLMMFFVSLTLNVLLQGAFAAIVVRLIIEAITDWTSDKQSDFSKAVSHSSASAVNENNEKTSSETIDNEEDHEATVTHGARKINCKH